MPKAGEVQGHPEDIAVSYTAELVTVWIGMESTDLAPDAADQLAAYLRVAANRARRLGSR